MITLKGLTIIMCFDDNCHHFVKYESDKSNH